MNRTRKRDPAMPNGLRLLVAAAVAAGLGVLTVRVIDSTSGSVELRSGASTAGAEAAGVAPTAIDPGDPRVMWANLPSSLVSPAISDGTVVWIAVAEQIVGDYGPYESGLYRFDPAAGKLNRVASFNGRPTAAAIAGADIVIGAGRDVIIVSPSGEVRALPVEQSDTATNSFISALEYSKGHLFVAWDGIARIDDLDLEAGAVVRSFGLTGRMPPVQHLAMLNDNVLVASTPFGVVNGLGPGSVAIELSTGAITSVDLGRPFSFARAGTGAFVTTQSVPGGGLREIEASGAGASAVRERPSRIPWNGRWDLLTVGSDGSLWGSVQGDPRIYVERPDGDIDSFALPLMPLTPSLPNGVRVPVEAQKRFSSAPRTVASMVALADGSLVVVTDAPGGALGYIAAK